MDTVVGNDCNGISISSGSNILSSEIGSKCESIAISAGSLIKGSNIGLEVSNFSMSPGTLINSVISHGCEDISITQGVIVEDSVISYGVKNKTFSQLDSSTNVYKGFVTESGNEDFKNYFGAATDNEYPSDRSFIDIPVVSNSAEANMANSDIDRYSLSMSSQVFLNLKAMPSNIPVWVLVNNTSASSEILTMSSTRAGVPGVNFNTPSGLSLMEFMRVKTGSVNDIKLISSTIV